MAKRLAPLTAAVLISSLGVALAQPASAEEVTHPKSPAVSQYADEDVDTRADDIGEALSFIDEIPDETVEEASDEDLAKLAQQTAEKQNRGAPEIALRANVLGCSASIATAIASAAFPAFKLAKVVRIVKKLGGPKATAEKIKEAGGLGKVAGEQANETNVTGMLASLAGELSGVAGIRDNCF